MKYGQLILGVLIGGVAYYLWNENRKKKVATESVVETIKEVKNEEERKYPDVVKKKFDIVMPSDLVAKKVRAKGKDFTERRYAVDLNKVKEPLSI
jgi:hypothetical protein